MKRKLTIIIGCAIASFLLSIGVHQFPLHTLTAFFGDNLQRLPPTTKTSQEIVLIDLADEYRKMLSERPIVPDTASQIRLLKKILEANPAFVLYAYSLQNLFQNKNLADFVEFVNSQETLTFAYSSTEYAERDAIERHPILSKIKNLEEHGLAIDKVSAAADMAWRRFIITENKEKTRFSPALENFTGRPLAQTPGAFGHQDLSLPVKYIFVRYRPAGTYVPIAMKQVLSPNFDIKQFKDKIIVLGNSSFDSNEYRKTPIDYGNWSMSHMEAYANAFDSIILGDNPKPTSAKVGILTTAIAIFALLTLFAFAKPILALTLSFAIFLDFWLTGWIVFAISNWVIDIAHTTVAMILVQYFSVPFLIIKYRQIRNQQETDLKIAQQKAQGELAQSRTLAKYAKAEMGFQIAAKVAHDLRSPLMAISTATSASQERLTPEEKNLFQESTKRINAIANDLLEKFRSGFDGTNNDQDGLEIGQQTKQLLGIYEQTWPEIEFKSIISEKQFFCTLPPTDFDRALSNILNNSTEALKGKGEIRVTIIEDAQHIEIHVCDNGPGIDPKIENRIFETGFTQNKAGGTGLGLAQAQDVFRSGGGDLKLIASDKGACFAASIPKSSAPQKLKVSREVFLAEDDPQIIELWKTKLQPLGCEVRAFTSPQDCLAAISLSKAKFQWTLICDLIFDDHELTGFDIFAEAKKQFSSPKPYRPDLILCTSLAENKEIRKIALSYGAKLIAKRHLKELSITLKI